MSNIISLELIQYMDLPKKESECAPSVAGEEVCSRPAIIEQMKKFIEEATHKPFKGDRKAIVAEISRLLGCDSESCVLSHTDFKSKIGHQAAEQEKRTRFKPEGPHDNDNLLNNINIDQCLTQYTHASKNFHHIPFQMIDFAYTDNGHNPLNKLNVQQDMFAKRKNCFGVVLNTDVSTGPGKHWFCLFGDFRNPKHATLEFFNSSGNIPVQEVHEFLLKLQKQVEYECNCECTVEIVSNIQIQNSRTECGPYSLYYIISRLNGIPLDTIRTIIRTRGIPDEKMLEFRKHLFRKS